ncbi:hypothetical protein EDC45_1430 [Mesocricetibacter intestinalis]|uniref:Uncharacterized protein n=1 Tax=Mesocricetibacter intestinalis TaxID=1521930 RepID=A0A4R6VBQ4_9PAST|nr:hypothetical protein EDC45_1430 [Mesocricetibacter intestinalis]
MRLLRIYISLPNSENSIYIRPYPYFPSQNFAYFIIFFLAEIKIPKIDFAAFSLANLYIFIIDKNLKPLNKSGLFGLGFKWNQGFGERFFRALE